MEMINRIREIYIKNKEIINYIIVGGFTTIVSVGSYAIFRLFIADYNISTVLSWVCAVIFAYVTNRIFVFESKSKEVKKEFLKFVTSRLVTLASEMTVMIILVSVLLINDMAAKIIVQFIILVLNYFLSKLLVFKK